MMKTASQTPGSEAACVSAAPLVRTGARNGRALSSLAALLLVLSVAAQAALVPVYDQIPDTAAQTGGLIPSSWLTPNGSDADMYAYDGFMVASNVPITEVHWQGGYQHNAMYGPITGFTLTFFESSVGGLEPRVTNPQFPEKEVYLAKYTVTNTAGETLVGSFNGVPLYEYSFTLPTPFQAVANTKYWLRVEASQIGYPDWSLAVGAGGDSQHFAFSTGAARFWFGSGDMAFTLLAPPGPYFTLTTTAAPDAGGSASGGGVFTNGASVTVVGTANSGYAFVNWTKNGTVVSTAANYTFVLATNLNLVANFAPAFTITTSAAPVAGGTTTGDGSYTYGASVRVSATASANYKFVNWTENGTPVSASAAYAFNAGANRALQANFVPANPNLLTVFSQPHDGSGAINKSSWYAPDGLDGDEYAYDNFMLTSNQPITKIRWRGGYTNFKSGAGESPVYDFTIAIYPSIAAGTQPDLIAGPLVTYHVGSNAGETFAGTFGDTPMYDYEFVLPKTFNAVANTKYWLKLYASQGLTPFYMWPPDWGLAVGGNGSRFDQITGGTAGGGTLYYLTTGDVAFTLFGPANGYSINTIASPGNGGDVSGGGVYTNGASVTVSAAAVPGYVFVNWNENGVSVSTASSYTFTASANRTLVANFAPPYAITATAAPSASGTVTGSGTYLGGTNVTLVATANPGYAFVNWTDNGFEVGTSPRYYFIADGDYNLVANFTPIYTITTAASPAAGGFVTGGGTYQSGDTVMVAPTPNAGYVFVNWTENGTPICNWPGYTFNAMANRALTATFAPACTIATAVASTNGFADGGGTYAKGAPVTVVATPNTGYTFAGWTENGGTVSTAAGYTFTAATNRTLVATFAPDNTLVTFDFDTVAPALTNNQALPFDQAAAGLTAHFSSDSLAAFSIQTDASLGQTLPKFSGHYLVPRVPGQPLDIQFSQPLSSFVLTFATRDFQQLVTPSPVRLSVFKDSAAGPVLGTVTSQGLYQAGDTMPVGTLSFSSGTQPFQAVRLEVPGGATDFLVDNITVATVPTLHILSTATNTTVVSWTTNSDGFLLQHNTACSAANWLAVTNPVRIVGNRNQVVLPSPASSRFFRLVKP